VPATPIEIVDRIGCSGGVEGEFLDRAARVVRDFAGRRRR